MNGGGLALSEGVLFWGLDSGRGLVRAFDFEGRALGASLDLGPGSSVSGLVADADRRVWVADTRRGLLLGLTLFGYEGAEFRPTAGELEAPAGGRVDGPVDVALAPSKELLGLWIASGGRRRAAVGLYLPDGTRLEALRSMGDPKRAFDRVTRLSGAGELLAVLEGGAGRVQVFRRGDFHFALGTNAPRGQPIRAVALLSDGRFVVALGDGDGERVLLLDAAGRELRQLAPGSPSEGGGSTDAVVDLCVEPGARDREARLFVLDREGLRVQVFNLEGRCYGAFAGFDVDAAGGTGPITEL